MVIQMYLARWLVEDRNKVSEHINIHPNMYETVRIQFMIMSIYYVEYFRYPLSELLRLTWRWKVCVLQIKYSDFKSEFENILTIRYYVFNPIKFIKVLRSTYVVWFQIQFLCTQDRRGRYRIPRPWYDRIHTCILPFYRILLGRSYFWT